VSLLIRIGQYRRIRDGETPHHQQYEREQDHKSKEMEIQGYLVHLLPSSFCNELIMLTLHERTMKRS
jgi:hypothetical protein